MDFEKLNAQLILHEGLRFKPYTDTVGKLTIGVGHNLTDRGITQEQAISILNDDVREVLVRLGDALPWWLGLDDVRQRVLADMAFNLGTSGLLKFKRTLERVRTGDYVGASVAMLDSKWATQVGARARRLAQMMATGEDA